MTLPNLGVERAERIFARSGLPPNAERAVFAEARYRANVLGGRFADHVASACRAHPDFASPLAQAFWTDDKETDG